jgi:hypothetical protein
MGTHEGTRKLVEGQMVRVDGIAEKGATEVAQYVAVQTGVPASMFLQSMEEETLTKLE